MKHSHRTRTVGKKPAAMPKFWRPLLSQSQRIELEILHTQHLDAIATGSANEETLWQWTASIFTWSKAAELRDVGVPEMTEQLDLATRVLERYRRTGRVAFTGLDYQLAKAGVMVMAELGATTKQYVAEQAAAWSEAKINSLAAECGFHFQEIS